MFPTGVDSYPFWICMIIFAVIVGNLIYESVIVHWLIEREERCKAVCCIEGEEDE
jgi:hypothetical protein|tara:strand:+ start:397 stop:561 length:165 start_codon:yes stop_codon:yes gene_type:complete